MTNFIILYELILNTLEVITICQRNINITLTSLVEGHLLYLKHFQATFKIKICIKY